MADDVPRNESPPEGKTAQQIPGDTQLLAMDRGSAEP
jgi:hypothetical protein